MPSCSSCGSYIPEGQGSSCSMCYGDIAYGKDGYYQEWAEQQERSFEQNEINNMDKFDELLNKLNELKIHQKSGDWQEDIPEGIFDDTFKCVASELDVDKHRWYETSIEVYEVFGRFLGVLSITDTFSEQSEVGDMCHFVKFFEMKAVPTITYEKL